MSDFSEVDLSIVEKVRKLLTQAEGTTYAEEAEAFYRKATDLMERHAIDQAMLEAAGKVEEDKVDFIECYFGSTYWQSWYNGLSSLGKALGFRPLIMARGKNGHMKWYGWRSELKLAEVLLASLQIQVARSSDLFMRNEYSSPFGMSKAQAREDRYRAKRSFIEAYLHTVATRIKETRANTRRTVTEANGDGSMLPILVSKDGRLQSELAQFFKDTIRVKAPKAGINRDGWAGGRREGAKADIGQPTVGTRERGRAIGRG